MAAAEDHDAAAPEEELTELRLVTLNCWGLKHLSAQRAARLQAIGAALARADPAPHVVALQECWTQADFEAVRRAARGALPYAKFYHSGAFGGGLAVLARWPFEESAMVRYPLNGRPTAFFRGDWFVGKGVACARLRYGRRPGDVLEVFNTHTHATYGSDTSYTAHRLAQAWELARLVRGAAERGHLAVALGDFNDVPLSLPHRLLTAHAPVRDVWRVLHPDSALGSARHAAERARRRPVPTARFNVAENGATSDSAYNTWRWPRAQRRRPAGVVVAPDTPDPCGKRLDYIFASSGAAAAAGWGWVVADARVGMLERHPELGCSLSDHFSVEATLVLHRLQPPSVAVAAPSAVLRRRPQQQQSREPSDDDDGGDDDDVSFAATRATREIPAEFLTNGVYLGSPEPSDANLPASSSSPPPPDPSTPGGRLRETAAQRRAGYDAQLREAAQPISRLPPSTYDEILAVVRAYMARERAQRFWRGAHFFAWVAVAVACYVGVWWSPRNSVAFVLMLLSSLGLVAGTVDGLIALLFIGSEMRALKEFEWEILNAKAAASGDGGAGALVDEEDADTKM